MGIFGADPNKLAIIASTSSHIRLLEEDVVKTMDKFGNNATVVTGELGKIDGMPLIISQYVREDLDATGVNSATPANNTKTVILIVYRGAFAIGDRLQVQLEAEREAKYGQDVLIGRERIDFQPWYPASTNNMVGLVYNVAKL